MIIRISIDASLSSVIQSEIKTHLHSSVHSVSWEDGSEIFKHTVIQFKKLHLKLL